MEMSESFPEPGEEMSEVSSEVVAVSAALEAGLTLHAGLSLDADLPDADLPDTSLTREDETLRNDVLEEEDLPLEEPTTPLRRLGSVRKLPAFNKLRSQFQEQQRVIEARGETAQNVISELAEYCRRRGELEREYARALDKLGRGRGRGHGGAGAAAAWGRALEHTRVVAAHHHALAALYSGPLSERAARAADHVADLHRALRDLVARRQDSLLAAVAEAARAGKDHATAVAEWRVQAAKLRAAAERRDAAGGAVDKRRRHLDKEVEKRRRRHAEARVAALRARAGYVALLEGARAAVARHCREHVAALGDAGERALDAGVGGALLLAAAADSTRGHHLASAAAALTEFVESMEAPEVMPPSCTDPPHLPYDGLPPEQEDEELRTLAGGEGEVGADTEGEEGLWGDLGDAAAAARGALGGARDQLQRTQAAVQRAHLTLRAALTAEVPPSDTAAPAAALGARLRDYVTAGGRLATLEARAAALSQLAAPARFAAPLPTELDRLPAPLESTVRALSVHGLRVPGLFRVSGSHAETAALRAAYERGEDPLAAALAAGEPVDVHAAATLLKLYLRSLRPPLLPPALLPALVQIAALPDDTSFVSAMRDFVSALPVSNMIVLRYLFQFLAHVSAHATENMMDAENVAVCVGPAVASARGEPAVGTQTALNLCVRRALTLHSAVFPPRPAPHLLYRPPPDLLRGLDPTPTEEPR